MVHHSFAPGLFLLLLAAFTIRSDARLLRGVHKKLFVPNRRHLSHTGDDKDGCDTRKNFDETMALFGEDGSKYNVGCGTDAKAGTCVTLAEVERDLGFKEGMPNVKCTTMRKCQDTEGNDCLIFMGGMECGSRDMYPGADVLCDDSLVVQGGN